MSCRTPCRCCSRRGKTLSVPQGMSRCFCSVRVRSFMLQAIAVRFRRFPYLVIGWGLLAAVSMAAPDRLFLTRQQGLWFGFAFLGIALLRGSRQVGQQLPNELSALEMSQLPRQDEMQYMGHGFSWDPQHANEVLAAEREGAAPTRRKRKPGDPGGVSALHAV